MSHALSIQSPNLKPTQSQTTREPSQQMRAVLHVLKADAHLYERVLPFIDLRNETIYWEPLLKVSFGSGHRAAITWIYGIWTDEMRPKANCFDAALSMDPTLQVAVLEALAMRWDLKR